MTDAPLSITDLRPYPPCPAPFNMTAHVMARADALSEKIALQIMRPTGAERWSYGKLHAAIRGTGTGLLGLGLTAGDRVLLRLDNTVDVPILALGAITAGLVPALIPPHLSEAEVDRIIADLAPKLIVAAPSLPEPSTPDCPTLSLSDAQGFRDLPPCAYDFGPPERPALIVFTSGRGGHPRAVLHGHRAIWSRGMIHEGWQGLRESDRLLHAGAFGWAYTLWSGLLDPWSKGATALIAAQGAGAAQLPLLMKRFDATMIAATPEIYRQILRGPIPKLPKLRHALSAGETLPEAVRAAWTEATGTPILEGFGMAECGIFVSTPPDRIAPEGAIGWPQQGRRIAILGEDGTALPRGEAGILAIDARDTGLFLGYLPPEDQGFAKATGEWFATGDRAMIDGTGAVTVLGREEDMLNASGAPVSPREVEAAMEAHPQIIDCAAVEVPLADDANAIALFYAGEALPEAELAAFAESRLQRYKVPRIFVHVPHIPKGPNTTLDRKALRHGWTPPQGGAA